MSEDCAIAITRTSLANAHGDPGDTVTQKVVPQLALGISKAHYGNDHYKVAIILTNRASARRPEQFRRGKSCYSGTGDTNAHYGVNDYVVAVTLADLAGRSKDWASQ